MIVSWQVYSMVNHIYVYAVHAWEHCADCVGLPYISALITAHTLTEILYSF